MLQDITSNSATPKASEISQFLYHIWCIAVVLGKYKDNQAIKELGRYVCWLKGMLAAVKKDSSWEDYISEPISLLWFGCNLPISAKLPKVSHDMLEKLAIKDEVRSIDTLIYVSLENVTSDMTESLDLNLKDCIDMSNWKEEMEELSHYNEDKLW